MKKRVQILLFIFIVNFINGQIIQDLSLNTNFVNNSYSMVKVGNYIYYTNSSPNASGVVYKFDYTSSTPTPIAVNTGTSGFSFLTGIVHYNGFLYVASNNCIWKIDLSQTLPTPQVYYYDDSAITGTYRTKNIFSLCVVGNDLYFHGTTTSPTTNSTIYKTDLTLPTASPVTVIGNINHRIGSLINVGNNMFISTLNAGIGIRKFDLTNTNAGMTTVINESGYLCKMTYYKNRIYYPNETTGTVKSFDPLETNSIPRFEFNLNRAAGLLGVDCDLYAATTTTNTANRIVKVRIPFVTGNSTQPLDFSIPSEVTIEDLLVTGNAITWFNSLLEANSNTNPIPPNTQLVAGNTYYAISTDGVCRSLPFPVTTSVLANEDFFKSNLKVYPNPVQDVLSIELTNETTDLEINITNILGQEVFSNRFFNTTKANIQMPKDNGIYLVKIKSQQNIACYKIVKN